MDWPASVVALSCLLHSVPGSFGRSYRPLCRWWRLLGQAFPIAPSHNDDQCLHARWSSYIDEGRPHLLFERCICLRCSRSYLIPFTALAARHICCERPMARPRTSKNGRSTGGTFLCSWPPYLDSEAGRHYLTPPPRW